MKIWSQQQHQCGILQLGGDSAYIDERLRERCFGVFEGTSNKNYESVWARDEDGTELQEGVEDVQSVLSRAMEVVNEQQPRSITAPTDSSPMKRVKTILVDTILVAHGDVLQILQTGIEGVETRLHRKLVKHLNPGELRLLHSDPL
eukprot:TRINITY_DN853_c0_g1_i1.p1 TRINITY_DN853_c0_g1~~TRINITY_DN853_c0_g1_i1.p1  ORF type:complete len:146 (-),score=23.94 TRINITY_DN853_c0_g1_i1:119-556(-)